MENDDKIEIITVINFTVSELTELLSGLDEKQINTVPYKNSWTAGKLFRHVTKSTNGMVHSMNKPSTPADRDPGEKIPELKKNFLDFTIKMQSPEFIIPEDIIYDKQAVITELKSAFAQLKASAGNTRLNEMVTGLPLGDITKLEILHFVLHHTQRHLHQMKKIYAALISKE